MGHRGKPLVADSDDNRCQAITILTPWKKERKVADLRCPFMVKLAVGKKKLCYRHALLESLAILVSDGTAKILPQPPRPKYAPVQTIKESL